MKLKRVYVQKGFTIIETLIAVSMLTIVIASTTLLLQQSLAANSFASQQVTANYLAGEAMEYIRNIRDSNFLAGQNWLQGLNPCMSPHVCRVDAVRGNISASCDRNEGCDPLRFREDTSGYYTTQNGQGVDSNYSRSVQIETISADEVAVKVIIIGETGVFADTPLVVVEHMFNWYE